jgi:hypothetical protein
MAVTERHLHDTSDIPPETLAQLAVKSETMTPWWWALIVLMKYRTLRNYRRGGSHLRLQSPPDTLTLS